MKRYEQAELVDIEMTPTGLKIVGAASDMVINFAVLQRAHRTIEKMRQSEKRND